MTFAFIAKHRGVWPVAWRCEVLGASQSGFHAWLTPKPSARSRRDEELGARIGTAFSPAIAPAVRGGSGMILWRMELFFACIESSG
jgi:hypothetical protein